MKLVVTCSWQCIRTLLLFLRMTDRVDSSYLHTCSCSILLSPQLMIPHLSKRCIPSLGCLDCFECCSREVPLGLHPKVSLKQLGQGS
jgi:hypothetical protein